MPQTLQVSRLFSSSFLSFNNGLHIILRHALQARNQFVPQNGAIVAHHGNCRHTAALDDGVSPAVAVIHAAHRTHTVVQPATPADAVITEVLEETQIAALDRGRRTRAAQCGDVLYRSLTDLLV